MPNLPQEEWQRPRLGPNLDRRFLRMLFDGIPLTPGLTITRRALRHDPEDARTAFHGSVDLLVADTELLDLNRQGWSAYFGIAPRRNHDGTKGGCVGIPALFADLDAKDFA